MADAATLAMPGLGEWTAIAGVVVTVVGGIVTFVYGVLRTRREDRKAGGAVAVQQIERRRAQAERVFAYWTRQDQEGAAGESSCETIVHNGSDAPVFNAIMTVRHARDGWSLKRDWPSLEPSVRVTVPLPRSAAEMDSSQPADRRVPRTGDHRVRLLFKDAANAFWFREEGDLTELAPRLVIWAERRRADALSRQLKEDFGSLYGIDLTFETGTVEELMGKFDEVGEPGGAPDVLLGPHDWLGRLAGRGRLEELVLTDAQEAAFEPSALAAMRHGGRRYGVPSVLDSVALIRNTDLAPDEPGTMEELISVGRELQAGRSDDFRVLALQVGLLGDAYHVWPLFSSVGGGLFGQHPDGSWNPADVLVGESVAAFEKLRSLGPRGAGVLRLDVDREQAIELFLRRRTAFLVCASRALGDIRRANSESDGRDPLRIAVSPVPPFEGGSTPRSFVSTYGFFVPVHAANKALGRELVGDYLASPRVAARLSAAAQRPSAHRLAADTDEDDAVRVYRQECRRGLAMPSFPYMKEVWRAFGETERRVISGADPGRSAVALARSIGKIVREHTDGADHG